MDRDTIIKTLEAVLADATSQVAIAEGCKAETARAYAMGRQNALQFALRLMTERTPLAAALAQSMRDEPNDDSVNELYPEPPNAP